MDELRQRDLDLVREQIGREPTTSFRVTVRCAPDGHPLVIRNYPVDPDGHPFPTLYWLTCPAAGRAISTIESEGAIARLNAQIDSTPAFADAVDAAHASYSAERADLIGGDDPGTGGVGGTRVGVKCLHAHYAYHLAGGDDPVGAWVAEQIEPIHEPPSVDRVAVIDQGTNSIRLLIAEPGVEGDTMLELGRDLMITRLGQDVDRTGVLDPDALDRTIAVLARFARRSKAMHAKRFRMGATSAVRDALNGDQLREAVRAHLGIDLEVLTGQQEAALSFLGAIHGLGDQVGQQPVLVVDIGGGSTEFVVGERSGPYPDAAVSLQIGSVRLTERHIREDPPTVEDRVGIRRDIAVALSTVAETVPHVREAETLIAVAGTATTMQAMALGLDRDDPDAIDGSHLSLAAAQAVLEELAGMTDVERAALPMMPRGRGDIIVAGAEILVAIMQTFGFDIAVISESDILDGLAVELRVAE